MFDYPFYKEGINIGNKYQCASNEYAVLNSDAKCWEVRNVPKLDNKKVKKTIIAFKRNTYGSAIKTDLFTGRRYVDNVSNNSVLFTGTDKELNEYALELMAKGYNIQDFYDYEE